MAQRSHSAEAEEKSLKLVEDFNKELIDALDSLGGKKANGLIDKYRFWSCKHLQRAVDGFASLRRPGRVDGSKFLVRPAIEMAFRLEAARQHPDIFIELPMRNTVKISICYELQAAIHNCWHKATRIGKDLITHS